MLGLSEAVGTEASPMYSTNAPLAYDTERLLVLATDLSVPHRTPVVAVTATTEVIRALRRVRVNEAYTAALLRAGVIPFVVPPVDEAEAAAVLDAVDGLLLTGGEDVDPARFGADRHPTVQDVHAARDRSEIALVLEARRRRVPTLAICRGIQVANVALGGTLIQDIPTQRPDAGRHEVGDEGRAARVHRVTATPGSRLADALGATEVVTNSMHHQAVDRPADGLLVTARADDGIVEGAEWGADDWWMVGVQWHPEELIDDGESWDRSLFAAFARQLAR